MPGISRSAMPTSTAGWRRPRRAGRRPSRPTTARKWSPITGRGPNFAEAFGLDVVGYVEPKPGIPPSPAHTLTLIQEMKRQGIKMILVEPYFDLKTPNAIARDTGAKVLVLPPSVGGVKEAADYIRLFDYDVNLLVSALKDDDRTMMDLSLGQILEFLAAPFVASLILTGIHSYLGLHVVERGVIFVDLSLAQIAALGGTIALLLPLSGGDPHAPGVSTGSACCSRSSARRSSRWFAAGRPASRRRRSSASATPSPRRRRSWP